MKKRYKVLTDIPFISVFEKDEILETDENGNHIIYEDYGKSRFNPSDYPVIFKELQWWEDIEEKDLPKYIKIVEDKYQRVYEVEKWELNNKHPKCSAVYTPSKCIYMHANIFPATHEEYLEQIKYDEA